LIGPGLAFIGCFVIIGLFSAIFHRDRNSFTTFYLTMSILGLVAAVIVLAVIYMTSSSIK